MNVRLLTGLTIAVIALAGCKTPTKVDTGPIKASTFSFLRPGPLPEAAFTENRQQVHAMVQAAIDSDLTAKGLRRVADGGDVTVAYMIVVGNNATTSAINDYFGYGPDAMALADKAQEAYADSKRRDYFEAGTLLIDLIDSRTQKVLRRNYVTRPILQNPTAEGRQANIEQAVNEALQGVRIQR